MALKCANRFHQAWDGLTNGPEADPYLYDSPHYSGFGALIHSLWNAESPLIYLVKPFWAKLPEVPKSPPGLCLCETVSRWELAG